MQINANLCRLLAVAVVAAGLVWSAPALAARVALVIGNQDYANLAPLQKAIGDADSYAGLFRARGFDRVDLHHDLTRQGMDLAIARFIEAIRPGDTAVFVYSGHGWSDGTQNYMVGIDAPRDGGQEFLKRISVPIRNGANGVVDEMQARGATLKVAIIDACRDNPFSSQDGTKSTGLSKGLNRLTEPPPEGTFLVFSAGAGQVALDTLAPDDTHPNGVFTRTFVPLLEQNLTLLDATKATQESVYSLAGTVGYDQQPAFYDETRGNRACLWDSCDSPGAPAVAPDEATWLAIAASRSAADFESFLRLFPNSAHRGAAEARLRELQALATPPPEPAPVEIPVAPPENVALLVQTELRRLGCYRGNLDGDWGRRSRDSLILFSAQAGLNLGERQPDAEILALLRTRTGTVCTARQPQDAPAGSEPAPTRSAGCYEINVTVDPRKPNGTPWDLGTEKTAAPDPRIVETGSGTSATCKDSFRCSLRVEGVGSTLGISLTDMDLSSHDPIGSGNCTAGRTCRIGAASVRVSAC